MDGREEQGGDAQAGVLVPLDKISEGALTALVEEFVTRDGTDYGWEETSLAEKKRAVLAALRKGELSVSFDPESQSANIFPTETTGRTGAHRQPVR